MYFTLPPQLIAASDAQSILERNNWHFVTTFYPLDITSRKLLHAVIYQRDDDTCLIVRERHNSLRWVLHRITQTYLSDLTTPQPPQTRPTNTVD